MKEGGALESPEKKKVALLARLTTTNYNPMNISKLVAN